MPRQPARFGIQLNIWHSLNFEMHSQECLALIRLQGSISIFSKILRKLVKIDNWILILFLSNLFYHVCVCVRASYLCDCRLSVRTQEEQGKEKSLGKYGQHHSQAPQ